MKLALCSVHTGAVGLGNLRSGSITGKSLNRSPIPCGGSVFRVMAENPQVGPLSRLSERCSLARLQVFLPLASQVVPRFAYIPLLSCGEPAGETSRLLRRWDNIDEPPSTFGA